MKRYLVPIMLLLVTQLAQAAVTATLDRSDIREKETFSLRIQVDEYTDESPDLTVIPEGLVVLSTSNFHRSTNINGVSNINKGWKVQLLAQRSGDYTIPPIPIGSHKTQPISLSVKKASNSFSEDDKQKSLLLKTEVDHQSIYVQQQLILTIKLYLGTQTQYAKLTEPDIDDAIIEKVGDDIKYSSILNGRNYDILERKYAIFPQKSGDIVIPELVFSADIPVASRGFSGYGRVLGRLRPVRISSEPITVNVKPIPTTNQGAWLPAKELKLSGHLPAMGPIVVGEPSTWTLTLTGTGLSENQLPELELPDVEGLKWYPDIPQKQRQYSTENIVGQRVEKIAVVPTKAGEISLPSIKVRWFNTETQSYEMAEVQAQKIHVEPNPEQQLTPSTQSAQPSPVIQVSGEQALWWKISTAVFALLWLMSLVYIRRLLPASSEATKKDSKKPFTGSSPAFRLRKACRSKDQKNIYNALLQWLRETQSDKHASLAAMAQKLSNTEIRDSLERLEKSLYSNQQDSWQDSAKLEKWLAEIEADLRPDDPTTDETSLPELYPAKST
ncbi:BatD family protein [Pleionea sp. CnH1-48]|uniref:BatD family protein n=1 Tax=Pleionea sp. CnH1-48 TaxID=2954494 RepID=UPI002096D4AF|nr:BatD family protein [Pleionea sp. CnH1-48]MCO7222979.1 BatD family protein [Pleionea sp. CnH1-48]